MVALCFIGMSLKIYKQLALESRRGAKWLRGTKKVPTMSQILPMQYTASEQPQVRTWGRQTCFLPRAPSNLVTLLSRTHFIFAHSVIFRGAWERLRTYSNDLWKLRMIDVNQTKFGVILVERKERFGFFCKSRNCIGYSILKSTWHSHKPLTSCNFHWRYGFHHFSHKFLFILNKVLRNIIVEVGHS